MKSSFIIGLTGSIGMGKSTTSKMFRDEGVPTWSADDAVHRLYQPGAAGAMALESIFPDVVGSNGVDRDALSKKIAADSSSLKVVENAIHPLVAADRARFVAETRAEILLLDIPLLFEIGAEDQVDLVAVVSVDGDTQKQRVLSRPGMTEDKFEMILSKQMPDAEKRRRAEVVIDTSTLESARLGVQNTLEQIRNRLANA